MNKNLISFFLGVIFSLGLGISQMTRPPKVLSFLDLAGSWDPTLAIVFATATITYFILYRVWVNQSIRKSVEEYLKGKEVFDKRVVIGAILFGTGWGIVGLCPGPALVNLVTLNPQIILFVGAMIFGAYVVKIRDFP